MNYFMKNSLQSLLLHYFPLPLQPTRLVSVPYVKHVSTNYPMYKTC